MAHYIKKIKTDMCPYAKGVVTTYQSISFSVTSLHPYQAMVTYKEMKAASDWFGFAKMQIAITNSFYHVSIHHQRAMEIVTNYTQPHRAPTVFGTVTSYSISTK